MRMIKLPNAMCDKDNSPTYLATRIIDKISVLSNEHSSRVVMFTTESGGKDVYATGVMSTVDAIGLAHELLDKINTP